ncbi:hypothetical protein NA57DRAFT_52915 [Rhizodiscina lignyota]|uniref:NADH dehydrogenase [ubiquinone] 1 beta subcomplex subunit 11, mitochondrial n=1 Tax=Rhizodiscina lignyota TaxID=1504668 RepID=A0A9P4ILL4_9PEZI|nr:hypothetical protein NA57DRAFT_52915 [Rhizodiscina lignyota]
MPFLRPQQPVQAARLLARTSTANAQRTFTSAASRQAASSHEEDHYDPPTGWLWGIPPGQKYEKEGWEGLMYYGFVGSLILAGVAYAFKPDTSIQTWALEEARRRLEKEGILADPDDEKK